MLNSFIVINILLIFVIVEWKNNPSKRPILLRGARQVGKSYSVREFGKRFVFFPLYSIENLDCILYKNKCIFIMLNSNI